jgi:choline dehydrogenase-like flavoprotein
MARSSSYSGPYKQAENRTNIEVLTYATVQQVVMSGEGEDLRATGVVALKSTGESVVVMADKEVVLAARTFQSPQLMVSVRHRFPNPDNTD